jgi:hypothetical protein
MSHPVLGRFEALAFRMQEPACPTLTLIPDVTRG